MAVPMTYITDSNPETPYVCTRCRKPVPLSGYRLLYHGKRRPLRCRKCEAATATSDMARYYARQFERISARKRVHDAENKAVVRARAKAWTERHRTETKEYKEAYYAVNRDKLNEQNMARYYAKRAERLERDRRRHAAKHRTPEALAARAEAKAASAARRRLAWRDDIRCGVAKNYGLPLAAVFTPSDGYEREARMVGIYLIQMLRRPRDRHDVSEIAADYGLEPNGVRTIITMLANRLARREGDIERAALREAVRTIKTALGYPKKRRLVAKRAHHAA